MPIVDKENEPESILAGLVPDFVSPIAEREPDHKAPAAIEKKSVFSNPFTGNEGSARAKKEPIKEAAVPANKVAVIVKGYTALYQTVGGAIVMFDQNCGTAIIENAEQAAASLGDLAKTNPKVANALLKALETSAWGTVAMAHAPIFMAIAMHHGPLAKKLAAKREDTDEEQTLDIRDIKIPPNIKFSRPRTGGA